MKTELKTTKEQQIFEAALKLFAHYGFKKTTIEDVAGELGMTKSNIYFYVKHKRDLYEKCISNALKKWRDSVGEAIEETDDVVLKFRILSSKSIEYIAQNSELRTILIKDPDIFTLSPAEDRFSDINFGAMNLIKGILEQGVREGRFYEVDIPHMTEFLFSIYIMFIIKAYVKSEGSNAVKLFEEGIELAIRGLCKT